MEERVAPDRVKVWNAFIQSVATADPEGIFDFLLHTRLYEIGTQDKTVPCITLPSPMCTELCHLLVLEVPIRIPTYELTYFRLKSRWFEFLLTNLHISS